MVFAGRLFLCQKEAHMRARTSDNNKMGLTIRSSNTSTVLDCVWIVLVACSFVSESTWATESDESAVATPSMEPTSFCEPNPLLLRTRTWGREKLLLERRDFDVQRIEKFPADNENIVYSMCGIFNVWMQANGWPSDSHYWAEGIH